MRTTVTLDPDVDALVQHAMREEGLGFKDVVNAALRRDLSRQFGAHTPFVQPVFNMGRPLVDLTKANALAGELEDEVLMQRLRAGT